GAGSVDYSLAETGDSFVRHRWSINCGGQIVRRCHLKIFARRGHQTGFRAAFIRSLGRRLQRPARDPITAALVARYWAPTTCEYSLALAINSAADRSGAGDDDDSRRSVGGAIQGRLAVRHHFNVLDAQAFDQNFAHPRPDIFAAHSCESDSARDDIVTMDQSRSAGFINRLTNCHAGVGNTHPQRVRWTSRSLAQNVIAAENYSAGTRAA